MFIPALLMPLVAVLYFKAGSQVDLTPIKFYRWTAFSYTTWLILPFVLGMLITMLVYQEVENNLLTQLWIVPVGKLRFIISKFCVMWLYSICFMLICASGSIVIGSVSGLIEITNTSVLNLILKCLEIGALLPFDDSYSCSSNNTKRIHSSCVYHNSLYLFLDLFYLWETCTSTHYQVLLVFL